MPKSLKSFLLAFLLSLPFWLGVNFLEKKLEESFFLKIVAENPEILTADISEKELQRNLKSLRPIRNQQAEDLDLKARAAVSIFFREGKKKVLFEKSSEEKLPIASLTKLMSSYVVLENYNLQDLVTISDTAVKTIGDAGFFKTGEKFFAKDLLHSTLIESSNVATVALVEVIGEEGFVSLMNLEAKKLELSNTRFVNATGLDPQMGDPNSSTCQDLALLSWNVLKEHPLIFDILSVKELNFYNSEGVFHHTLVNKNELLGKITEIIGGKTGYTLKANGCLILATKVNGDGFLINVILGSEDRFVEMEQLLNWVSQAYAF